jgi:steroid delta-isomerase-like uncharacterized protein
MVRSAKQVVRLYWEEIFNKGKFELVETLFSPNYAYHGAMGEEGKGLDFLRQFMNGFKTAFPDALLTVEEIIDGGNRIAVRHRFTGTHRGPLGTLKASGKKVNIPIITVLRLARGKVVEEWEQWNEHLLLKQIGAVKE